MEVHYRPGSAEDFDRLYRDNYPRLVRTLYAVLGDAASAEDCVQDTFVRAFSAWDRFRPEKPAGAWLHQIAINTAISYKRKQRLREVGELLRRLGRPAAAADPADLVGRSDLVRALSAQPPQRAAVFVLRHYHGYTNRELAMLLGVSERSIGEWLRRTAEDLKARLGSDRRPAAVPISNASSVEFLLDHVDKA